MTKEEKLAINGKMEEKGRQLFEQFFNKNKHFEIECINFFKEKFNTVDVEYYSGFTNFTKTYAEIKTRKYLSTKKWDDKPEGWILEKHKYDQLKKKIGNTIDRMVYINIFLDGIAIWDLTYFIDKYDWYIEVLSTDHYREEKKEKFVKFLKIEDATHFFKHDFKF